MYAAIGLLLAVSPDRNSSSPVMWIAIVVVAVLIGVGLLTGRMRGK